VSNRWKHVLSTKSVCESFFICYCFSYELDCIARTICIDAVYCYGQSSVVCRSVCLLVCLSVILVSTAKTAEPIEIWDAVWVEDSGGPGEPLLDWVQIPHGNDTLPWAVQNWLNRSICHLVVDLDGPKEAQIHRVRQMAPMCPLEPSVCGGNTVLCQITLTTSWY